MSKARKILIILAVVLIIMIGAVYAFVAFLPLSAIKQFAEDKLSETLNREVEIENISFNIFSGFTLSGVEISNHPQFADRSWIAVKRIDLNYSFWALFARKILINKINIVNPEIFIEKRGVTYNFSDLLKPQKKIKKEEKEPPFSFFISKVRLTKGKVIYSDVKQTFELDDCNLSIDGITLSFIKPIDLAFDAKLKYLKSTIPLSLKTKIAHDSTSNKLSLSDGEIGILKQTISFSSDVNYKALAVNFSAQSNKLTLDPFLAIFAKDKNKEKKEERQKTSPTTSLKAFGNSIPSNLKVTGDVSIKSFSLLSIKGEELKLSLGIKNRLITLDGKVNGYKGNIDLSLALNPQLAFYTFKKLNAKGIDFSPLANDVIDSFLPKFVDLKGKIQGNLDLTLYVKGKGISGKEILYNSTAVGHLLLTEGRLKKIKLLENLAEKYNLKFLAQDMYVSGLRSDFTFSNAILNVKKLSVEDTDLRIEFQGKLDLANQKYIDPSEVTFILSPKLSTSLPKEMALFKDERGFTEVTFALKGSLKMPIPTPVLKKPVEKAIGKVKLRIEAEKIELERKAEEEKERLKKEAEEKKKEEEERLKKEAEEKVKEILKF